MESVTKADLVRGLRDYMCGEAPPVIAGRRGTGRYAVVMCLSYLK